MIQTILSRLEGVKKQGEGWVSKCPAHDDQHHSLSIAEGEKGIVLKCFAFCEFKNIVAKIGMKPSDLFYDDKPPNKNTTSTIGAIYKYVDESEKVVYEAVRLVPKSAGFRFRVPDGKGGYVWKLGDARRVLYNLPLVLKQKERGGYIFICEGEKDADRLVSEGFVATTNAGGADNWDDSFTETLAGAEGIILLADNDEPGKKRVYRIKADLEKHDTKSRIIELPGLAEHGDVSDWLDHGGTAEALKKLIKSPFVRPADMVNLTDTLQFVTKYTAEPLPKGLDWPWPMVNKLTRGLRGGWLCYLAGRPSHGKTAAAIEMALNTARANKRVLFISMEMGGEELAVRVAQRNGLDTYRFYSGVANEVDIEAAELALGIPHHANIEIAYTKKLQRVEELIAISEPELLIVDYLGLVDIGNHSRTEGTTRVSHAAKDIARRFALPSLWNVQLRRLGPGERSRPPMLSDLRDSGNLENDADTVIMLDREVVDNVISPDGAFYVAKARMGQTGKERFSFEGSTQEFITQ